ncbi:hypothetical protein PACTADRAFT_184753 [Pachysolen tannophilus NRRL Y-2460]|uniref:3beta-hydroxysteroid 3-dehydrogenase n=1 Tax=Pachysolen tannophilus NRRL Y-2460 TaxID=669874 RepID=A0A1E4U3R9_PACTA|nr:hypothetical protein PACTADRAFT_184753 [Pachysolen tannophilus NRRL Y-2460]
MAVSSDRLVVLITGTNSNLGVNLAYRFLETAPREVRITLIVTSRTLPRANEVIKEINDFNRTKLCRPGLLDFDYLLVDFTNMVSILAAYYELIQRYDKIDYLYVNAAQGVYDGIDWVGAAKEIATNPIEGVTQPHYKIQRVGVKSKDGLGLVFQANVFGPYYFIHKITKLLQDGGTIVWISSIMSSPSYLSFNDLQLIRSTESYEGSKRLVDLLHLATYKKLLKQKGIRQYVVQPGIFISYSFGKVLNLISYWGMILLFYVARWLGSPWHNISGYNAANSAITVSLLLDEKNFEQDVKYGSACDRSGKCYMVREQIDSTGCEDVLAYMEKLRNEWDELLKDQISDTRKL